MKIKYIFIITFVILAGLFSQSATDEFFTTDYIDGPVVNMDGLSKGPKGDQTITMIFAKFKNNDFEVDIDWMTNPTLMFPTMFSIPKLENPDELESIEEYVQKNGSLLMYDYFGAAIPEYFNEMSRGKLNVVVNFEKNPERDDGLWELPEEISHYTTMTSVGAAVRDVIDNYYYTGYFAGLDGIICYNFEKCNGNGPDGQTNFGGAPCYSQHRGNFADLIALNVHELGHSMLNLPDTGNNYEYPYQPEYDAEINGSFAGRSNTTDGPFNMMWHNTFLPAPYARYGLFSFATNDMIRLGYIEDTDVEWIEEKVSGNKTDVRIKAVSKAKLGDKTAIKIPVTIDSKDGDLYRPSSGSGVESQYFLVEYRNSQMYDAISGLGYQGESKGILVTHIINSDTYMPTMDIEIATPYPRTWSNGIDPFRNPDSTITQYDAPYLNTNGDYYAGKKDVDWLDDLNANPYRPEHGMGAYWKAPNALNARSLPTDFFTGSVPERNKFTPTTYPSSDSWKLQDSHIAVYMNSEDDEYADITIYRNYWSKPILAGAPEIISGEGYIGENLTVETGAILTLDNNSIVSLVPNTNMIVQSGAKLVLLDGSTLGIEDGANIILEPGSIVEVNGDAKIAGDFTVGNNAVVDVKDGGTLSLVFAETTIGSGGNIKLQANSKLINMNGSHLTFDDGSLVESSKGAEIVVWTKGYFTADGTTFTYVDESGTWLGINAISGSSIGMNDVNIIGAETGVKGLGNYQFYVTNSTFTDCVNGIELVGVQPGRQYTIEDNNVTGIDDGRGISITSSDGVFSRNNISHFNTGVSFIMSSPAVSKCDISYNKHYGIIISGHDAIPQLINTEQMQAYGELNCTIGKNGYVSNTSLFPSGNIGIIPVGSIYMRNNDVYSSPRFPGISIAQQYIPNSYVTINAQYNYWGAEEVNDDYFFGHTQYTIDYTPYNSSPGGGGIIPTSMQDVSTESRLLSNALNLETKDKDVPAIKLYENIIRKYEDSPEYYVAMARLPYLYEKAKLDNNVLITTYDEALESENISHKKFFKGKKVATHIKGKRYDEAIAIAEEMKDEAEIEEEIILADINIAIANMFKDEEGKGRSEPTDYSSTISNLLAKLNGDEETSEKTDIISTALPSEFTLYQNYPNPFNPTTEIKFALPTASDVKLNVYNINGQLVSELVNGSKEAGIHSVNFNASNYNSGMYFYTLEANGLSITKKMILTK
ncbi:MAG: T9SS type A sorting domain-containing protein [Candidatus Delongbacteria bacterium]|jgi:hypothetical protein|nr:T9SS type A sorting domain-containing protein [Candidatus Delongbacteria bacterium]